MKKILLSLVTATFLVTSCTRDDVNTDPNVYYTTKPDAVFTYAQKQLSDYITTPNVNVNNFRLTMQYWQETTYVNESNYDFTNRSISNNVWLNTYVDVLKNLDQARGLIEAYQPTATEVNAWPNIKKNQLAIIDMLMVYTFQSLVDTYGDIPYSQSLNIDLYPLPKYDSGADIYTSLIGRLKVDIANLNSAASFGSSDTYYGGNVSKWKKFGNSLLLKLGIGIADSNSSLAQSTVNAAISGGVFTSSADDCTFNYLGDTVNYSQLYANLVASGRDDYFGCKTLVDFMNNSNDKRIEAYFQPVDGAYIGQEVGVGGEFTEFSAPGEFAYSLTSPGIILNYTEVEFYLAEAAARWGIGSAATHYNNAVKASFEQWGVDDSDANDYLAANPYDSANWKKSIGEQAWVAMYDQALTSWNFYRRLDYPQLVAPSTAIPIAEGKVPVRLQYPQNEASTNGTNYAAASTAIGGDKLTTKVFWDKN